MIFYEKVGSAYSQTRQQLLIEFQKFFTAPQEKSRAEILRRIQHILNHFRIAIAALAKPQLEVAFRTADLNAIRTLLLAQEKGILPTPYLEWTTNHHRIFDIVGKEFFSYVTISIDGAKFHAGQLSRRSTVDRLIKANGVDKLLQGLNDGFLIILGKDGKHRTYDFAYYGKMIALTAQKKAETYAALLRAEMNGLDLVRISPQASTIGDFCDAFKGRVFSLSGKSSKYPHLHKCPNGGPPFHPWCYHTAELFIEELATEQDLKVAQDFNRNLLWAGPADTIAKVNARYHELKAL